ncbi:MAG: D-alanyl-D-alanine carboxypeptidase/D-alanyl-D-alanine-endopeptidase [Propionibacteriaceae bacterium]|nr:D-alanyl-D-alanine carboxypeptidase/D-alanyl-D-alanine-endopeptidase [Propionibacteriaceae bacterium]
MARRGRWAGRAAVWVGVLTTVLATVLLQVVVAPQLADDPRVGAGQVERPEVADPPHAVLPELGQPDARVDPAALAATLDALPADGLGDVVALVTDARTGEELYRRGSGTRVPASSLKVLSALVALEVLGPQRTFTTSTHLSADGGTLVLRGGGDPLLAGAARPQAHPEPASLEDLAARTAEALRGRGVTTVALGYDASLFAGPAWNPAWPDIFARSVAPITALTADHARVSLEREAFERAPDPARFAVDRFGGFLLGHGIAVTGTAPVATPADATELAAVDSLPVRDIAQRVLAASDNDAAETLLWHVALARGRAATPADGAAVFAEELAARGLWGEGMAVQDGNGISSGNAVTPDALVGAVRRALADPALRPLTDGLPVAAVTGTLQGRFDEADAVAGRGVVRAKTGTIRGVNTLTGYVVTADGQPLAFALMTSGGAGQTSARAWLDRASAALAACGCR